MLFGESKVNGRAFSYWGSFAPRDSGAVPQTLEERRGLPMERWQVQAERISRIALLVHPGCTVWFRKDYMPVALGFRVISLKGEILCDLTGITWLKDVSEMSDE